MYIMYGNKGDPIASRRGLSFIQRTTGDALRDATTRGSVDKDAARMTKGKWYYTYLAIILTEPECGNLIM